MLDTTILDYIHKKSRVTRNDLCEHLDVGPAVVTRGLKTLFTKGMVIEDGHSESTGGRPSALVRLNPDYSEGIGLIITRKGCRAVRVGFNGSVVKEYVLNPEPFPAIGSMEEGIEAIKGFIRTVLNDAVSVSGIGIAISGIVDRRSGVSQTFPDFDNWRDVPLKQIIEDEFSIHTSIESLIHASVRGEYMHGIGVNYRDLLYIRLGMGISCGAVFGGEIYYSHAGVGGELGHTAAVPDGPLCYCGKYGCLESIAAPVQIERAVRQAVAEGVVTRAADEQGQVTLSAILSAAEEGDRLARNMVERAGDYIGRAASNLFNVFAPEAVILAGEYINEDSFFFTTVASSFRANRMENCGPGDIIAAELQDNAALIGAGDISFAPFFS